MAQLPPHLLALEEETTIITLGMSLDDWFSIQESDACLSWYYQWLAQQQYDLNASYRQWGATLDAIFRDQRQHSARRQPSHAQDTVIYAHE